jgi:hypothetical protein
MRSFMYSLFLFVLSAFLFSAFSQAVDVAEKSDVKVEDIYNPLPDNPEMVLLFNNGPFVTNAGAGPGGSDHSVLQNSTLAMTTLGAGHAISTFFRVADDFTVPALEIWTIDSIVFFGYQTGAGIATSTFNNYNYRVWNGSPMSGGTIVFGDTTTNRLIASRWTNAYRVSQTTVDVNRPIFRNVVSGGFTLQPGTYWLDWAAGGTLASGPWANPITITGQTTTGNSLQRSNAGVWAAHTDGGSLTPQGLPFLVYGTSAPVPVELTAFAAASLNGEVKLEWTTATEVNNQGFEVERSFNGSVFVAVGHVSGNGTTTETKNYTFVDKGLDAGSYSYRLKQIDFDGTFEYSHSVEVDVVAPAEFGLAQNYPNPFNPSTAINFSLAADANVSLKVFNLIGEEVALLVNTNMSAGSHTVNFDASSLNSGVYFYRLEANSVDGSAFSSVKKMILTK